MPFPMVHLSIAYRILNTSSVIKDPGAFLLGSFAPDAIRFRPGCTREMRNNAHLCIEINGLPDISEWCGNTRQFYEKNRNSESIDFIYGYCTHIYTDICNTIEIYGPFRAEHCKEYDQAIIGKFLKEGFDLDQEMYRAYQDRERVWNILKKSNGIDIDDWVSAEDIGKLKHHILYEQYEKYTQREPSTYQYVTMEKLTDFIDRQTKWIENQVFSH